MVHSKPPPPVDPAHLDVAQLAFLVGVGANATGLAALHRAGFDGLRVSHGFVFQHLLGGPQSITELAALQQVSQQAASKVVAELTGLGYVERAAGGDARTHRVGLSARGMAAVKAARRQRATQQRALVRLAGGPQVEAARALLVALLEMLGGTGAVRQRRVLDPNAGAPRRGRARPAV